MIDNQELALESQISEYFTKDNRVTTHFKYEELDDEKIELRLYTFNTKTGANFLFHKLKASSGIAALSKMLVYISTILKTENNYIVTWNVKGEKQVNKSHFRSADIEAVMVKFYEGKKDREELEVTNVKLKPTVSV